VREGLLKRQAKLTDAFQALFALVYFVKQFCFFFGQLLFNLVSWLAVSDKPVYEVSAKVEDSYRTQHPQYDC